MLLCPFGSPARHQGGANDTGRQYDETAQHTEWLFSVVVAAIEAVSASGALCVASKYVVDWVAQPSMSLDAHVLLATRRSMVVASAEAGRREEAAATKTSLKAR